MVRNIFFDLDGTLTDSGPGIIRCAGLALEHFGITPGDEKTMGVFVGPPLRDTFARFGVPAEGIEEAVQVYRLHYNRTGKFENTPYPGIRQALETLQARSFRLFVATSKPEALAIEVLTHFDLAKYFEVIRGGTPDGSRDSKALVIQCLLDELGEQPDVVMVGDTTFDVLGAKAHGLPTIGVSWGYGSREDMELAGAKLVVDTPEELLEALCTPGQQHLLSSTGLAQKQ